MKEIKLEPVESSNIAAMGYDKDTKKLHVLFHSGSTYEYADVTPEEHKALKTAQSVGKVFHRLIRGVKQESKIG